MDRLMAIQGVEWLILLIITIVAIYLVVKFPTLRLGIGVFFTIIGILLFLIPLIGPILGALPFAFGLALIVWGAVSLAHRKENKTLQQPVLTRICPKCGRNLSNFPGDIKNCPYCGNQLI
ncbi:MAG: zinc ribbon domain-containing protein [Nitrososphaerota archaeon]